MTLSQKEKLEIIDLKKSLKRGWQARFLAYLRKRGYKITEGTMRNLMTYNSIMNGNSHIVTDFIHFAAKDQQPENKARKVLAAMVADIEPDGSLSSHTRDMGDAADEDYERERDSE